MPHAQNKPLSEYGDLNSVHHVDAHAAKKIGEAELAAENAPASLVVIHGVGGSYSIEWSKGEEELPMECHGLFTGRTQALHAIDKAKARLKEEAKVAEAEAQAAATKAKAASRKRSAPAKEADEEK